MMYVTVSVTVAQIPLSLRTVDEVLLARNSFLITVRIATLKSNQYSDCLSAAHATRLPVQDWSTCKLQSHVTSSHVTTLMGHVTTVICSVDIGIPNMRLSGIVLWPESLHARIPLARIAC